MGCLCSGGGAHFPALELLFDLLCNLFEPLLRVIEGLGEPVLIHVSESQVSDKNMKCVREIEILVEQQTPQGILVRDDAGPVINKLSQ